MTGDAGHRPGPGAGGPTEPQPAAQFPQPAAQFPQPAASDGPTDAELLAAHSAGDSEAFNELVRRHRDRLWAVAIRTTGDREEAADALQDALLSAHRAAARFRGDSAVTTWLHRIVVNACLDRLRRRQARPTVPLPDGSRPPDDPYATRPGGPGTEPAAPLVDHDTALVVRAALAQLPPEQRAALVLVDLQGYPVTEVAAMLGVAEGTIKSRCARGRAQLALTLADLRPGRGATDPASGNRKAVRPVPSAEGASGGIDDVSPGHPSSGHPAVTGSIGAEPATTRSAVTRPTGQEER